MRRSTLITTLISVTTVSIALAAESNTPAAPHVLSPDVAAKLAQTGPKYDPAASLPANKTTPQAQPTPSDARIMPPSTNLVTAPPDSTTSSSSTEEVDVTASPLLHEPDKPKNTIVRLPNYLVREKRLPEFKERDLLTREGRIDLAYKRHPALRATGFGFANDSWALEMLAEEDRLDRLGEINEFASLYGYGNAAAESDPNSRPENLRLAVTPIFARTAGWVDQGGPFQLSR